MTSILLVFDIRHDCAIQGFTAETFITKLTSNHSIEPMIPYSSPSQLQNTIDLLGFQPKIKRVTMYNCKYTSVHSIFVNFLLHTYAFSFTYICRAYIMYIIIFGGSNCGIVAVCARSAGTFKYAMLDSDSGAYLCCKLVPYFCENHVDCQSKT